MAMTFSHRLTRRFITSALGAGLMLAAAGTAGTALAQGSAQPKVELHTSLGNIVLQLDPAKAPKTVENFLQYVRDQHYDGTIFHRVIGNFMIQGGGFNSDMQEKATRAPIALEAGNGLRNTRYSVAMARRPDPNSATAQFFINVQDNPNLDAPRPDGHGYAVFGNVVQGQDVVDKIRAVPTGRRGMHGDVPTTPVVILSARIRP